MKLTEQERSIRQEWEWRWVDLEQRGFIIRVSQGQVQRHGNYKSKWAASKACSLRNAAMRKKFKKTFKHRLPVVLPVHVMLDQRNDKAHKETGKSRIIHIKSMRGFLKEAK